MADKVGGKMPLELSRVAQSIPNILKQCYMFDFRISEDYDHKFVYLSLG